jgi:hypothetical protein
MGPRERDNLGCDYSHEKINVGLMQWISSQDLGLL